MNEKELFIETYINTPFKDFPITVYENPNITKDKMYFGAVDIFDEVEQEVMACDITVFVKPNGIIRDIEID